MFQAPLFTLYLSSCISVHSPLLPLLSSPLLPILSSPPLPHHHFTRFPLRHSVPPPFILFCRSPSFNINWCSCSSFQSLSSLYLTVPYTLCCSAPFSRAHIFSPPDKLLAFYVTLIFPGWKTLGDSPYALTCLGTHTHTHTHTHFPELPITVITAHFITRAFSFKANLLGEWMTWCNRSSKWLGTRWCNGSSR